MNFTGFHTPVSSDSRFTFSVRKTTVFQETTESDWHILPVIMFHHNLYGSLVPFSAPLNQLN